MNETEATFQNQQKHWSRHAARYEELFIDPFAEGVVNPLWEALEAVPDISSKTVADLGCGTGPLLPWLSRHFAQVIALDFAPGMLQRAREQVAPEHADRVRFLQRSMDDLEDLAGQLDVVVAINSLVLPDERMIDQILQAIRRSLRPGGVVMGIVPSIDAIQYHTMLLMDLALEQGLEPPEAMRFTALHAEHKYYNFAFTRFRFAGLRQKFWLPFEVEYRLKKAGFRSPGLEKVLYPWPDSIEGKAELSAHPPIWDWFFRAST